MEGVYRSDGHRIDYVPSSDVAAGTIVLVNSEQTNPLFGLATQPIAAGELGSLQIDGVWDVLKMTSTDVFSVGFPVYWNEGVGADLGNMACPGPFIGWCVKASANGDTTVRILRNVGR